MIPLGVLASAAGGDYTPPPPSVPISGLVLYLDGDDFTNDPQTTSWADRSPAGNHGVPSNFAYTAASGSDGAGSVVFDGTNDIVNCGNATSLDLTSALTLCGWFYYTGSGTYARLITKEGYFGVLIFPLTTPQLGWYGSGVDAAFPTSTFAKNVWVFWAVTYNGTTLASYINGETKGTQTKNGGLTSSPSTPVTVGDRTTGSRAFGGKIGAQLVYNRVLTAQELSDVQIATAR